MLIPRSHALTQRQKQLIVGASIVCIALSCAGLYVFERFHGLPSDSILVGTWEMTIPYCLDCATWVKLQPDHIAVWFSDSIGGYQVDYRTRWFAAGPYIYMRYEGRRQIWEITKILPDELRLRAQKHDYIFKRVTREPPEASNQAMQLTAPRPGT